MASSRYTPVASESHSTQPDDQEDRVLDGRSSAEVNPGTVPTEQHSHPAKDSHFTPQSVQAESTQKFPSHGIGFRVKDWWEEFAAVAFSLSSLLAIVIILAVYRNKTLSSWQFVFNVSLNTVVAILSTLSRTALLVPVASCISQLKWIRLCRTPCSLREVQVFDDASHGPLGSIQLLWELHSKTWLASWGAAITLLALAMDPFVQQLLSYPSRTNYGPGAVFYASQVYDPAHYSAKSGNYNVWEKSGDPKMQGAIVNGLYNLSAPVDFVCPTGNCEWDTYTTLAVKSTCTNVTTQIWSSCKNGTTGDCYDKTPSGYIFDVGMWPTNNAQGELVQARTSFSQNASRKHPNSTILSFATYRMQNITSGNREGHFEECDLSWIARVVKDMAVRNGTFHPGVYEEFPVTLLKLKPDQREKYHFDWEKTVYRFVEWDIFLVGDEHSGFPGRRFFGTQPGFTVVLSEFLTEALSSKSTNLHTLALVASTNLTQTVAAIGTSMSYALGKSPSATQIKGRALSAERYIQVHWPWIILPLVVVTMGVALLVCTLIYTQRRGARAWKSSGIVPMLATMKGWDSQDLRATSWRDIEKRSKNMHGMLVPNEKDALIFKRVDG